MIVLKLNKAKSLTRVVIPFLCALTFWFCIIVTKNDYEIQLNQWFKEGKQHQLEANDLSDSYNKSAKKCYQPQWIELPQSDHLLVYSAFKIEDYVKLIALVNRILPLKSRNFKC